MKLYHYTDSNALIGVLEHKKFWLNDVNFMNDSHELFDAVRVLEQAAMELNAELYIQLARTIGSLRSNPPEMMHFFFNGFLIASFCKEDDLLEMWRGYGTNGQKYSLEIDSSALLEQAESALPEAGFSIEECLYKSEDKLSAMKAFLEKNPHPDNRQSEGDQSSIGIDTKWLMLFFRLALTFKNTGFESEREIRLIGRIEDTSVLKHRVNNFGITPYYELSLTKPTISACRIGPTEDRSLCLYSLTSLVKKSGSDGATILCDEHGNPSGSKFRVNFSDTSFRQR